MMDIGVGAIVQTHISPVSVASPSLSYAPAPSPGKLRRPSSSFLLAPVAASPAQVMPNPGSPLESVRPASPISTPPQSVTPSKIRLGVIDVVKAAERAAERDKPLLYARHPSQWRKLRDMRTLRNVITFESLLQDTHGRWAILQRLAESDEPTTAVGEARCHPQSARHEAARKLIIGRVKVLTDVTNPSPVTQLELQRVERCYAQYVDEALREVARRLVGRRTGVPEALLLQYHIEVKRNRGSAEQMTSWSKTAKYLAGRIQATREERPGREPDMSPEAAAAMRAVLAEVGTGREVSGGLSPGSMLLDALPPSRGRQMMCTIS